MSRNDPEDNGFAEWGGYMAAKKAKLVEQYEQATSSKKKSDLLKGVAIFVNGYTSPSAEELKVLMAVHGGVYHTYQMSSTTHIVASNLPNAKVNKRESVPIVKASWISDSITAGKLLDCRKYLLYTNHTDKQPKLDFLTKPVAQTSKTLTAADPGFLSEFYNNSRLHLISTLGAEYKQLVNQLREKSDGVFPGRERLKPLSDNFRYSEKIIMHIDMDCFFVSVGLRSNPHLRGEPVAVTHGRGTSVNRPETSVEIENELLEKYFPNEGLEKLDSHSSMAEVASCSYEARQSGVRNGMFLGTALKICPNLKVIPYDFEGYREVSTTLYNTIAEYTLDIEAVSCDEMYVDVSPILKTAGISVDQWATHIRKEIMDITGCPCSTGFGANRLQARLATKNAKPAGQFYLQPKDVEEYISNISLSDLPGVGHATVAKLSKMGLHKCSDIQMVTKAQIQSELGNKIGQTVMDLANGIDNKPLNFHHERKSISADVNYGIRFKDKTEAYNFLQSLSDEVYTRLKDVGMRARCLSLKLLVRAPDAPQEPAKYLGCGVCNTITRSTTNAGLINDAVTIYKEARTLLDRCNITPSELRGVGIQLTRLETAAPVNTAMKRFLQKDETVTKQPVPKPKTVTKPTKSVNTPQTEIDMSMLKELPEDVRREVIKQYGLEDKFPKIPETKNKSNTVEEKSAFDNLALDELKVLILKWLQSTSTPNDIDVTLLANHLRKLAIDRKIELLKILLNFLYRHISQLGSCLWHEAYWKLIDIVQEVMVARYGSTILVERNFCCSLHF